MIELLFTHSLDMLCNNALDLSNGKLIVYNNWQVGTYCQWILSAVEENSFITLEFQKINVSCKIYYTWSLDSAPSNSAHTETSQILI